MSNKKTDIVTPPGTLKYAFFNTPRDYQGDGKYKYSGTLVCRGPEAEKLAEAIEEVTLRLVGKPHAKLTHKVFDRVTDENGAEAIEFKLKVPASGKNNSTGETWDRKPKFVQANGTHYHTAEEPQIGSGSVVRVELHPHPWPKDKPTGIQLQPLQIKVLKLVEYVGRDSEMDATMGADESGDDAVRSAPRSAPASTTDF